MKRAVGSRAGKGIERPSLQERPLRAAYLAAGLTRDELARLAKVTPSHIARGEREGFGERRARQLAARTGLPFPAFLPPALAIQFLSSTNLDPQVLDQSVSGANGTPPSRAGDGATQASRTRTGPGCTRSQRYRRPATPILALVGDAN